MQPKYCIAKLVSGNETYITSLLPEEWSDDETLSSQVMTFSKDYAEKMCEEIGDGAFICDPPEFTFADIIEGLE